MNRNLIIITMVLMAVATRLLPHPPNVAPITGIALFAGHQFGNKRLALIIPILCMFISDLFLGFHSTLPFVYLAFISISFLGIFSRNIHNGTILTSSTIFFIVTNFGVWLLGYPNTLAGFISCYTLAIPFFVNTILGDLFFTHSLNYSFNKIEKKYPNLSLES
ncbi:MAG: DUF6580 family putative transport protein [Candidatus Neomarinimicrobiota bacterium]|nr:MAG: hypothetical protein EVA23_05845 [bacterium]